MITDYLIVAGFVYSAYCLIMIFWFGSDSLVISWSYDYESQVALSIVFQICFWTHKLKLMNHLGNF